jgi:hypothetical protein
MGAQGGRLLVSEANRFVQVLALAALERARRQALREAQEKIVRAKTQRWIVTVRDGDRRAGTGRDGDE